MDIKKQYLTFLAVCAQAAVACPNGVSGLEIRVAAPLASAADIACTEPWMELTRVDREVINRVYRFVD